MKVMPVAVAAFGLWACGDEAVTSAAQCTTKECLEQVGQSAGIISGGESSSSSATETLAESSSDGASGEVASSSSESLDGSTSGSSSSKDVASSSSAKSPFSSSSSVLIMPMPSSSSRANPQSSSSATKPEVSSSSESTPPTPVNEFVEDHRSECQIGDIPTSVNNAKLPDPFKKLDGTRISSKADWKCRREEIGAMYEKLMFGTKPRNPEKVEGSYSGGKLTIKVTDKGKSGSFSVKISNAGTKDKPKPAMIGFGRSLR